MPNMKEFQFLTESDSLAEGIEKIKKYSPGLTLVVKDGANGAYGWNGNDLIHQPAFLNEKVVDCIGAGDSFNAGFIYKFTQGAALKECLEFGALTGAISTTKAGGTGAFENLEMVKHLAAKLFSKQI
jgi:sugar/nucleoside kinase (ribokinase family)